MGERPDATHEGQSSHMQSHIIQLLLLRYHKILCLSQNLLLL